jgi:hypothetical protein
MAKVKTIIIDVDSKKATKGLKDVEKGVDGVNKEIKETGANTDAMTGQLDKFTGGAVSGFKSMLGGVKGLVTGFKSMRVAIISTGIGALIIGIVALAAAFKGSEEGQNKFNKIMSVIGALTGNLVDLLADLGESLISAFENPKKAVTDFANLIKDNIVTRFEGLLNLIPNLGKAVEQLFKGNFKEAGKIAADSVGKVVLGIDSITDTVKNATNAVKEFAAEQVREGKAAAAVADMRAKADKIERGLIVERSKLESEIALLRLKSRQEDQFTAEERKQALLDAQELEDSLLDKETQYLELRRDAQIQENTFSRSNKENLTKEAEAIAAVNRQVASRANTARQVQREVNTISKQIEAENKAIVAEEKADAKALSDFKKTLRDAEAVSETDKRNLELIKIQEHYDSLIAQASENNLITDELEAARDEAKKIKQKEFDDKDLAAQKATAAASAQITQLEVDAKQKALNGYAAALSSISGVLGQESEAGKGIAIASSLINTYASITGQLKAFSGKAIPGYAIAQAIATGAVGFANVKKIASVKIPNSKGGGGGATGSSPSGGASSQPPSFNIVGASDTNQLADAIGGQAQQPVQAFVVANDVTTAQSLQNNIVEGATIG